MRRTASEVLRNLEVRIARLESSRRTASMRRTAYSLDRYIKREIVDMINSDFDIELSYRDVDVDIEDEGRGASGTTYLLCSADSDLNNYYVLVSVDGRDYEVEMTYDNYSMAKSDFDGWTR